MSPYNTPILPVKKPDGTYRMVQDLRIINEIVKAGHPTLPDPYTILNQIPSSHQYYSVLDLKDAFWGWPITEDSKQYFAFEWEHEEGGKMGYKNSPTIFGEQLAKDLESWEPPPGEGQLLQYVDDLLIATWTQETRVDWTVSLLNFLGLQGYRVSQKKAQMVRQTVIYLGYESFLKYQAILVEQDDVEIVVTNIVNPASFLSGSMGEPVIHDCLETIEATYSSRPDLKDTPLEDAETWFTDGSSYVVSGRRHAGYAVTTSREVIESGPLPTNTSAQKAEIIALIRALELAKRKEINIYTDSRYAFGVVLAHGAIWKERGLLNSQGKSIKHAQEILRLLDAVQLPERVAIMHIKAHQKVSSELEEGNMLADREAKEAAKGEVPDKAVEAALIPDGKVSIEGDMLLVEEADYNLLGRDLMVALGISLIVRDSRIMVGIYKLTREDEKEINPEVCHTGREAGRLDMDPISIEIERPEDPIRVKQTQLHSGSGLSPFEMLYGMPYEHGMPVGHPRVEDGQIQSYLVSINKNLQELQRRGLVSQSTPLGFAIHKIHPGDKVLVKTWKETPLTPHWEGPFLILLTTDTAVRTSEKGWTHSSGVKRIESGDNPLQWKVTSAPGDLKLKIHRQT
ncbi:hypothetical protein DUI87_03322 [Hirundo rustica rustica]|uniref:ribonuclease H n=1 Tax=Hirundo rustica rustica TaxID=333673 RepID=A0A3M0L2R4_HIRRU|nr:hypothetical protein DUI87_03322 [Hirundo rustica rustica]